MSIGERFGEELKEAMRQKNADRVQCIRQVRAKVQEVMNAKGFEGQLDDALHIKVITTYVKSLSKAIEEMAPAGDKSAALRERYQREIDYLTTYLPRRLDENETRALVERTVNEVGAVDAKASGKIVGLIMKGHKDEVDSALVRRLVEERLAFSGPPR